jgi:hypothetical protein
VLALELEEGDVLQVPAVAVAGHDALQLRGHVGGNQGLELLLPPHGSAYNVAFTGTNVAENMYYTKGSGRTPYLALEW